MAGFTEDQLGSEPVWPVNQTQAFGQSHRHGEPLKAPKQEREV